MSSIPVITRRFSAAASTLVIFALILFPLAPFVRAGTTSLASDTENASQTSEPLQFTSQGHVLGFREEGVIVASARHMLKIDFLHSKGAIPKTDDSVSNDTDKAPPLDRVTYQNVWDGVTAVYEANDSSVVKSTYYLDDGAHTDQIRLGYNRPVQLDEQGNLVISYEHGTLTESAPIAWQEVEGRRQPIDVSYILHGEREVGFSLGQHIPGIPVVIDPDLSWNTFLGGSGTDLGRDIALDGNGNVYITGQSNATWGTPLRAYTAGIDAYVAKLNGNGTLVWNTFLGDSGSDIGNAIALDGSGNVYVGGYSTVTWGTPVRAYTAGNDVFAAKLDGSGALVWNTFLGGSGSDTSYAIAVDGSGNVYIAGISNATWGTPVLAHVGNYDILAVKLDSSGALVWNTFLGSSGSDWGYAMALDGSGNVYIAGDNDYVTWGTPVRPFTTAVDAFVAKLDGGSGALVWNTFLGGSGGDYSRSIAVDGSGNVYIAGQSDATWGTPVQAYTASLYDAYVAKLDGGSGALVWHTFLGGSGTDNGDAIAFDGSGNVYIAGDSNATWGTPVRVYSGGRDVLVAKLDSSGALVWNTFLGGSGTDWGGGTGAGGMALDGSGNVYVAGLTNGATWGTPVRAYTAGADAYVAKLLTDVAVPGAAQIPNIALTKDATPPSLPNGPGEVIYDYVVKNWGQVTLTDVTLEDDQCADLTFIEGDQNGNGWLETTEEWTYRCTQFLSNTIVSFATVRALGGGLATSDTAIIEVFVGTAVATGDANGSSTTAPVSVDEPPPPATIEPFSAAAALENSSTINLDKGFVLPVGGTPIPCESGSLIKLLSDGDITTATDSAVYYCGEDGRRHVFPDEGTYFSWYPDFSQVISISTGEMEMIPIGINVTYRPGSRMVKVQSDPKVYAIAYGGVLRWVTGEAVAQTLYGADWNTKIDDIPDAFFGDYTIGPDITLADIVH